MDARLYHCKPEKTSRILVTTLFIYNTSEQKLISNNGHSTYRSHSYGKLVSVSSNMIEDNLNKQKPFNSFKGFDEFSAHFVFEEIKGDSIR